MAVVGASRDPAKRGHQVVAALRASGFKGPIYPVNPAGGEILGRRVQVSIDECAAAAGEPPDVAYIGLPARLAPEAVRACGQAGVQAAIVPALGFRESGSAGARLEDDLIQAARSTGIRMIGPNTSGLLNTHAGLHLIGGEPLPPGSLGIVAQSGNLALDLMTRARESSVGVSVYVGVGNETDLQFHEFIDWLAGHEPTGAIAVYMEGARDGRAFFEAVGRAAARKPVVVLKGGKSTAGARAAASHTASLAGDQAVFSALARQFGAVEVDRSDELMAVAEALVLQPPARRTSTGGPVVVTDGGGHGALAADALSGLGCPPPKLAPETMAGLRELLGPSGAVANPVDMAGASDHDPAVLARAAAMAAEDPACEGVLVTGMFGGYAVRFDERLAPDELAAAERLAAAVRGKFLIVHSVFSRRRPRSLQRLTELGVPVHGSLERAARCVAALTERGRQQQAPRPPAPPPPAGFRGSSAADGDTAESAAWMSEPEARDMLSAAGVEFVQARLCATPQEAAAHAEAAGGRVAVKAVSRHLQHKTEAGAVRLNVCGARQTARAAAEVLREAEKWLRAVGLPETLDGILVSPMLPTPVTELILGVRRDPCYGPVLAVGRGGATAELDPDIAIRGLPVNATTVAAMCSELRCAPMLQGFRGAPAADLAAIARQAAALAGALEAAPELREAEINPLFVYEDRAVAVDALARMANQ